jgi:hypothetical protein
MYKQKCFVIWVWNLVSHIMGKEEKKTACTTAWNVVPHVLCYAVLYYFSPALWRWIEIWHFHKMVPEISATLCDTFSCFCMVHIALWVDSITGQLDNMWNRSICIVWCPCSKLVAAFHQPNTWTSRLFQKCYENWALVVLTLHGLHGPLFWLQYRGPLPF